MYMHDSNYFTTLHPIRLPLSLQTTADVHSKNIEPFEPISSDKTENSQRSKRNPSKSWVNIDSGETLDFDICMYLMWSQKHTITNSSVWTLVAILAAARIRKESIRCMMPVYCGAVYTAVIDVYTHLYIHKLRVKSNLQRCITLKSGNNASLVNFLLHSHSSSIDFSFFHDRTILAE